MKKSYISATYYIYKFQRHLSIDDLIMVISLGLVVLDTNLIIYGQRTWCILDLRGKIQKTNYFNGDGEIHFIKMLETLDSYSMISWTGDLADPRMVLDTYKNDKSVGTLEG